MTQQAPELLYKSERMPYPKPFLLGFAFAELGMHAAYAEAHPGAVKESRDHMTYARLTHPQNALQMALEMRKLGQEGLPRDIPAMRTNKMLLEAIHTAVRDDYSRIMDKLRERPNDGNVRIREAVFEFVGKTKDKFDQLCVEWDTDESSLSKFESVFAKVHSERYTDNYEDIDPTFFNQPENAFVSFLINHNGPRLIQKARAALVWVQDRYKNSIRSPAARTQDLHEWIGDAKQGATAVESRKDDIERAILLHNLRFTDDEVDPVSRAKFLLDAKYGFFPEGITNIVPEQYQVIHEVTRRPTYNNNKHKVITNQDIVAVRRFYFDNILSIRGALKAHLEACGILSNEHWALYCWNTMQTLSEKLPVWPERLRWDEGLYLEPPEETNVDAWPISTLLNSSSTGDRMLHPKLYDTMPCMRTTIVSLLASLDYNPLHQAWRTDREKSDIITSRVLLPYSVVIYVAPTTAGRDAQVFVVHARTLTIPVVTMQVFTTVGRDYIVYDANGFNDSDRIRRCTLTFEVENHILTRVFGATEERDAARQGETAARMMTFRVMRLLPHRAIHAEPDSTKKLKALRPDFLSLRVDKIAHLKIASTTTGGTGFVARTLNLVTQQSGNSCTSYASMFILLMLNGYGKQALENVAMKSLFDNDRDTLATYINITQTHYTNVCRAQGVANTAMTRFRQPINASIVLPDPKDPKNPKDPKKPDPNTIFSQVKQAISIGSFSAIMRSGVSHDAYHPYFTQWGMGTIPIPDRQVRLDDPLRKRLFSETSFELAKCRDNLMSSPFMTGLLFEGYRGYIGKRLMNLVHSPALLSYDVDTQTYRSVPVAIGITMRNIHSIALFLSEETVQIGSSGTANVDEARRYFHGDSIKSNGHISILNNIFALEEFFIAAHQLPIKEITTSAELEKFAADAGNRNGQGQYFDCDYYVADRDCAAINTRLVRFVTAGGMIKDDASIIPPPQASGSNPSTSTDTIKWFNGLHYALTASTSTKVPDVLTGEQVSDNAIRKITVDEDEDDIDIVPV